MKFSLDALVRRDVDEALNLLVNAKNLGAIERELVEHSNETPEPAAVVEVQGS